MKIFLIGMPGSGKTTLAQQLATHLQLPFIDLDEEIVKAAGKSIKGIFEQEGEDHFRELERERLQYCTDTYARFVMATGGGTPCFFDNMEAMKKAGTVVFLNTSLQTIQSRLAGQEITKRPLMKDVDLKKFAESFKIKFDERMPVYQQADVILEEKQQHITEVKPLLQSALKSKPQR
jgi:shikimate kinase